MIKECETYLKAVLFSMLIAFITGFAFTCYWEKEFIRPMLAAEKQNIINEVKKAPGQNQIKDYNDIIEKTNAFYNQQFSTLLWVFGSVVTIFGIGLPLILSFFQYMSLKEDREEIKRALENAKTAQTGADEALASAQLAEKSGKEALGKATNALKELAEQKELAMSTYQEHIMLTWNILDMTRSQIVLHMAMIKDNRGMHFTEPHTTVCDIATVATTTCCGVGAPCSVKCIPHKDKTEAKDKLALFIPFFHSLLFAIKMYEYYFEQWPPQIIPGITDAIHDFTNNLNQVYTKIISPILNTEKTDELDAINEFCNRINNELNNHKKIFSTENIDRIPALRAFEKLCKTIEHEVVVRSNNQDETDHPSVTPKV